MGLPHEDASKWPQEASAWFSWVTSKWKGVCAVQKCQPSWHWLARWMAVTAEKPRVSRLIISHPERWFPKVYIVVLWRHLQSSCPKGVCSAAQWERQCSGRPFQIHTGPTAWKAMCWMPPNIKVKDQSTTFIVCAHPKRRTVREH